MLDEKKELAEYICKTESGMTKRLTYMNLTNKLSGIRRALVIIAGYAFFERKLDKNSVTDALNAWCGFETDTMRASAEKDAEFFGSISGWLPCYINLMGEDEKYRNKVEETLALLASKRKNWNYDPFFSEGRVNDRNAITFTSVLAEAVNKGPLKERVITFKKDPIKSMVMSKGSQDGKKKVFIMAVAAYCAESSENRKKVHLDRPAFSNWVGEGCKSAKKVKSILSSLSFKAGSTVQPLFLMENIGNEDVEYNKIFLNEDFVREFDPKVMSFNEYRTIPREDRKKLIVYADRGCNVCMQRIY